MTLMIRGKAMRNAKARQNTETMKRIGKAVREVATETDDTDLAPALALALALAAARMTAIQNPGKNLHATNRPVGTTVISPVPSKRKSQAQNVKYILAKMTTEPTEAMRTKPNTRCPNQPPE
jgi:hypothetical protein